MREKPILFSAPMVRALLAGKKTQTRRVVKPWEPRPNAASKAVPADVAYLPDFTCYRSTCPYGQPGDLITVRETFYAWGRWETRFDKKKGRDAWHFVDMTIECGKGYYYAADGNVPQPLAGKRNGGVTPQRWKRPPIFMPAAASRSKLEVVSVRVERLQDISEADALAEGITHSTMNDPRVEFRHLWESINGAGSWSANPFVWVVEFKRVTP